MEKKLGDSQKILAGLTKGDFEAVGKSARNVEFLGYLEKYARADLRGTSSRSSSSISPTGS